MIDRPWEFHASFSSLSPGYVRRVLSEMRTRGLKVAEIEISSAQQAAWENIGLTCVAVYVARLAQKTGDVLAKTPTTMAGIPLNTTMECPNSEILFKDASGKVIAKITNLAIPAGFY